MMALIILVILAQWMFGWHLGSSKQYCSENKMQYCIFENIAI